MNRPDREIDAFLEGTITAKQSDALQAWINAAPANAAAFLHLVQTHQMLSIVGKELKQAREALRLLDQAALASLAEMEASAQPVDFRDVAPPFAFETALQHKQAKDITLLQALDTLRWAAGKVAVRLIRSPQGITAGVAALLLIGLLLLSPWTNDPTDTTPDPITNSLNLQPVATLTASHNAVWDSASAEGALAPGSDLRSGQRLTLTQGFAEITTNRGAVAILQAPATIELTDSDNALQLHSGKLVGICETESSKGFVVRTPHMNITDLGTRFGVDASLSEATSVHIYEGEVEVVLPPSDAGTSPTPQRLKAGQAVRASAGLSQLALIELDRSILNHAMMPTNVLAVTGIGLNKGQVDPAWRVVAVDGKPITAGGEMRAHADTTPGGEGDTGPMFLKIDDALLLANERSGVFTCRSIFEVPVSFDPATHRLVVWVEGDHSVKAVRINGQPMDVPANVTKLISLAFEQALTPGRQQIEIDIQEMNSNKQLRSGLRVKLELQRKPTTAEPDNP